MSTTFPETVSVDYIRLATFNFQTYLAISAAMRRKWVGWRKSRWLQYAMERSQDGPSYGLAEQQKRPHGIFEASGIEAHIFLTWIITTQEPHHHELYCSRIDLQRTKAMSPKLDYTKAYKRALKPKQVILSPDGNTLYIGNRESDSFWRVYQKTQTQDRVEVELKGNQAKKAFRSIIGGHKPSQLYDYYLSKSRLPKTVVEQFFGGQDPLDSDVMTEQLPEDLESTFLWLASLDSLIYKMTNDHDYGDRTRVLVKRWAEYGEKP